MTPRHGPPDPRDVDTDDRPFVLIWEVTQACELACDHCRASADSTRHPDELTTSGGKRLLDSAARFGKAQLVVLSGGDPMKRDDLVELVRYGTEQGLRMTLTPSGTEALTSENIAALADAGLRRMALSIDAPEQGHDEFRGENGSFRRTREAAAAAREAGIPVQINTTVCASTVETLSAVRDLVEGLGAVLWSVFFLVPIGRGELLEGISPERAETVLEWLHETSESASFGIKTTEAPSYRRVALQRQGSATEAPASDSIGRRSGIVAGDGFAFVSHTGEMFPSGFLPKSAGNVTDSDPVSLYQDSDLFRALRDREQLRGKCGACKYRNVCGGSRSRAFATTGDPLASDPLCAYVPDGYSGPLPWDDSGSQT